MSDVDRFPHLPKTGLDCEVEIERLQDRRVLYRIRRKPVAETERRIAGTARLRDWLQAQEVRAFDDVSAASERRAKASFAQFETNFAEAW